MAEATATKTCSKCGETKPSGEFYKRSRAKDGLAVWCKSCTKAYSAAHYEANRELVLARSAARFAADPDAKNERSRQWYYANRERAAANSGAWRQANREYFTRFMADRRGRLAATAVGPIDYDQLWTGACGICRHALDRALLHPDPMSKSIDHIVPLVRGGTHTQGNLQWAHLRCNISKGARLIT